MKHERGDRVRPPARVERVLARMLEPMGLAGESIVGDVGAEYEALVERVGRRRAAKWYRRQAFGIAVRAAGDRLRGGGPFHPVARGGHGRTRKELWSMHGLLNEMRFALRSLGRSPQYAAAAVLTLALAVAANTVVFSVVNSVLLEPLPYPDSDRLVFLRHAAPGLNYPTIGISPGLYHQYDESVAAFESSALYTTTTVNLTSNDAPPERVSGQIVTHALFGTLRVAPALGRTFTAEESVPDGPQAVVLSHALWSSRYGEDGSIVGRTIRVDGREREVVGVMPEGFAFPSVETMLWLPLQMDLAAASPGNFAYTAIGRLGERATLAGAKSQMDAVIGRVADAYPDSRDFRAFLEAGRFASTAVPAKEAIVGDLEKPLLILLGTAALVLLIACANVMNLFLVRAEARQRDTAVRSALGAPRSLLARQFLAESLVLAIAAAAVGIGVGAVGVRWLVRVAPPNLPRLGEVGLDAAVLAYAAGMAGIVALVLATLPALRLTRPSVLAAVSRGGVRTTTGHERNRTRQALVVLQTALALVLLAGSGLMLHTFAQLRSLDPGFDPDGVLTFRITLPQSTYGDALTAASFHERLIERLRALPGVQTAGAISTAPLANSASGTAFVIEDHPVAPDQLPPMLWYAYVSRDYFDALGIPVRAGTTLESVGREDQRNAILISENVAERFWPGQDPIGKRIRSPGDSSQWSTVIGVAGNVRERRLQDEPGNIVYFPMVFAPDAGEDAAERPPARTMTYIVRSPRPAAVAPAVRAAVWELDSDLPIAAVRTMDEIVADSMVQTSFTMLALAIAATLALFLGAIGLYGVISYLVSQRTREIGLRIALGAHPASVRRMVVWQGFRLAVLGLAAGLLASLALTRLLGSLLYGTSPNDPATFAAVVGLLGSVAFAASWLPALRASRVDPARTLQAE